MRLWECRILCVRFIIPDPRAGTWRHCDRYASVSNVNRPQAQINVSAESQNLGVVRIQSWALPNVHANDTFAVSYGCAISDHSVSDIQVIPEVLRFEADGRSVDDYRRNFACLTLDRNCPACGGTAAASRRSRQRCRRLSEVFGQSITQGRGN